MEDGIFCEDILVDILSRFPKKTLSRFKCVSKGWYALISYRVLPKTTDVGFLCQCISRFDNTIQTTFFRVDKEGSAFLNHSLGFSSEKKCLILDSRNGLLLLKKGWLERLYVYNPTTKHTLQLPHSRFGMLTAHASLASNGKNYKVIRFFYNGRIDSFDMEIYSSQTCQWKEIELEIPRFSYIYNVPHAHSVSLKGAIHWIWGNYILIYHLEDDYCKLIKLPTHKTYRYTYKMCIWDSEGFLHYCECDEHGINIWVLHMEDRNYNRDQHIFEWQLKHSAILMAPTLRKMFMGHSKFFSPRAFNDDFGIVYLMYKGSILLYNLATGMLKEVCAYPFEEPILDIYPFSYSLVESP
ncbi:F-box protein At5g07610-like [Magnolia sinica]|uniref:F-box protein At5g07610-like n=1 Tax=Magnolia sinica TaxID=86752 RepID=UPI00265AF979|nr:F-box protein At5g07610-like [Magnolia sinica]